MNKETDPIVAEVRDVISPAKTVGPVGIGGWLGILIVGLVIMGPLVGASRIGGELASAESQFPNILTLPAWGTFKSAIWANYFLMSGLSLYAGLGLFRRRSISVVRRAKIILWIIGPVAAVMSGLIIPLAIFGKVESDSRIFASLFGSVFFTAIWTAYLYRSRRVSATYS